MIQHLFPVLLSLIQDPLPYGSIAHIGDLLFQFISRCEKEIKNTSGEDKVYLPVDLEDYLR